MAKVSQHYLEKIDKWILQGLPVEQMAMTPDQKFRARITYEVYQLWLQDKQIRPADVFRRVAQREYALLLQKAAEGDEKSIEYCRAMNIKAGVPRTMSEIANDVETLNHIIARFDVPMTNIEKAKVQDASDWLIRQGMKMGDARAVKSGADLKMQLNNNFEDNADPQSQMAKTDLNITGDVSVVKSDRVNYTLEEKKKMARKYGISLADVEEMLSNESNYVEAEVIEEAEPLEP